MSSFPSRWAAFPEFEAISGEIYDGASRGAEHRKGTSFDILALKRSPHYSPPLVSCALRIEEIRWRLESSGDFLRELGAHCLALRKPQECAQILGFDRHRLMPRFENSARFKYRQALVRLVYRCDPRVQYERYPAVAKAVNSARAEFEASRFRQQGLQAVPAAALAAPVYADAPREQRVLCKYAVHHLQHVLSPGDIISIDFDGGHTLRPLIASEVQHRSAARIAFQDEDQRPAAEDDVGSLVPVPAVGVPAAHRYSIFRVIHVRPGHQKYIHSVGFKLQETAIALSAVGFVDDLHDVLSLAADSGEV